MYETRRREWWSVQIPLHCRSGSVEFELNKKPRSAGSCGLAPVAIVILVLISLNQKS